MGVGLCGGMASGMGDGVGDVVGGGVDREVGVVWTSIEI